MEVIRANHEREEQYAQYLKDLEDAERQERELRAQELKRAEEEEREEREKGKQELIDKLETSSKDAAKLVARARLQAERRASSRATSSAFTSTRGRGRTAQVATIPDVPHVPLQDDWYAYEDKFTLRTNYDDPISEAVRRDREGIMRAGGYFVEQAWERALRTAVAGLEIQPLKGLHLTTSSLPSSNSGDVIMPSA